MGIVGGIFVIANKEMACASIQIVLLTNNQNFQGLHSSVTRVEKCWDTSRDITHAKCHNLLYSFPVYALDMDWKSSWLFWLWTVAARANLAQRVILFRSTSRNRIHSIVANLCYLGAWLHLWPRIFALPTFLGPYFATWKYTKPIWSSTLAQPLRRVGIIWFSLGELELLQDKPA